MLVTKFATSAAQEHLQKQREIVQLWVLVVLSTIAQTHERELWEVQIFCASWGWNKQFDLSCFTDATCMKRFNSHFS